MLGASASGTIFLSLKRFEATFAFFPDVLLGNEILQDVCTAFTKPGKEMAPLPQPNNCLFLPHDGIVPEQMLNSYQLRW